MRSALRTYRGMLMLNGIGLAAFLAAGSRHWMAADAARDASLDEVHAGEAWELYSLLIVAAAVLANIVWVARAQRRSGQPGRAWYVTLGVFALLCWAAAFVFDAAHNGVRVR